MGFFDSIFGGGEEIQPVTVDPRSAQRAGTDRFLLNFLKKYGSQYQPGKAYAGQMSAPMSGFEGRGLDEFLNQFLNQPDASAQTGDVRSMLNKTITGGFDPNNSPYYQALRDTAGYNRKQAITQSKADAGARGQFFSQGQLKKEGDINAQTQIGLNQALAQLADQERGRQMSAVSPALGLEQYLSSMPLSKASAATTIGALPRELQQADLERLYQDFLRQQGELGQTINAASGVSNIQTQQRAPAYGPSIFEKFIAPVMSSVIPGLMSGGTSFLSGLFGGGGTGFNPATMSSSQVMPGGFGAWR